MRERAIEIQGECRVQGRVGGLQGVAEAFLTATRKIQKDKSEKADETRVLLKEAEKECSQYRKSVEEEYESRVSNFKKDREELLKYTEGALERMTKHLKEMKKYAEYVEYIEEEITTDVYENMSVNAHDLYKKAQPVANVAAQLADEVAKEYEKDGKYIKERRGGSYDAKSYGVSEEDGAKLSSIFNQATQTSGEATNAAGEVASLAAGIAEGFSSITGLYFGGKKTLEKTLEELETLATSVKQMVDTFEADAGKIKNSVELLDEWANNTPVIEKDYNTIPIHVQKIEAQEVKANQSLLKLRTAATRGLKRIPKDQQDNRKLKGTVELVRTQVLRSVSIKQRLDQQMSKARQDAKTALDAGPKT